LRALHRHNDRAWFQANRDRYLRDVRDPLLAFVDAFGRHLERISPHFLADPSPVGGSMFRIHRDTRFSRDKSPYKTHAAAQFRHRAGKDVHAPGFYLHLEPGNVFAGAGIWRPDRVALQRIRERIAGEPEAWKRAIGGREFRRHATLDGDRLVRAPKGFPPDHPMIEDLKWKDYVAVVEFDEGAACSPDFLERFAWACRVMAPLVQFLTEALGLPF
jgi:uncharacterized protein (TIGR02453 family)